MSKAPETIHWSRPLGAMEKMFFLTNLHHANHFCLVAQIRGSASKREWLSVLTAAFAGSPQAWSKIVQDERGEPHFVKGTSPDLPIKFVHGDPDHWEHYVQAELTNTFDASSAPLMRAVVLGEGNDTTLMLSAHHSIADGLALAYAIDNVVNGLRGESLRIATEDVPVEDLVARATGTSELPSAPQSEPLTDNRRSFRKSDGATPSLERAVWPAALTERLRQYARERSVTLHSAVCAAAAAAYRAASGQADKQVRVFSPVDVRDRVLGGRRHVAAALTGTVTTSGRLLQQTLWDEASQIEAQLLPFKQREGIMVSVGTVDAILSGIVSPPPVVEFLEANLGCDILVTNLGNIECPARKTGPSLTHMWGPAVTWGFEGEQALGLLGLNNELHLVHTSFSPFPGYLAEIRSSIEQAISAAPILA